MVDQNRHEQGNKRAAAYGIEFTTPGALCIVKHDWMLTRLPA